MTPRTIVDFFASGGVPMLPLFATAAAVVTLAVRSWRALEHAQPHDARLVESRIDAVLFWGLFSAVVGVLGTLGGIAQMADFFQNASGTAPASLIWGGIRVALSTTITGISILAVALVAWQLLRRRWLRLHALLTP